MEEDDPYADTDHMKVVVYPTLIIPAYQVKKKKRNRHPIRWYVDGLIIVVILALMLAVIVILALMMVSIIINVAPGG